MKKLIRILSFVPLLIGMQALSAHTNKTFLKTRPHGVNIALVNPGYVFEAMDENHNDDEHDKHMRSSVQAIGFYQESTNKRDLGKYFAVGEKYKDIRLGFRNAANKDLELGFIIHDTGAFLADRVSGSFTFEPDQQSYGIYFNLHQDFSRVCPGLHCCVNIPVVYARNDINFKVTKATDNNDVDRLVEYFRGDLNVDSYLQNGGANSRGPLSGAAGAGSGNQARLTHALIDGSNNHTAVADVDIALGYHFYETEPVFAGFTVGLTVPTGNKPTGKKAFEAIVGNGGHVALGAGLHCCAHVWGDDESTVSVHSACNYRYLFKGREIRTLGVVGRNFGQYHLVGEVDVNKRNQQLRPAANILTQEVDVAPYSNFDALINVSYHYKGYSIDFGYNAYVQTQERVRVRQQIEPNLIIVNANVNMNENANLENGDGFPLLQSNIDASAAATPALSTHKLYGNLGYTFDDDKNPITVGLGGHFEFRGNNAALETWGINARLTASF